MRITNPDAGSRVRIFNKIRQPTGLAFDVPKRRVAGWFALFGCSV